MRSPRTRSSQALLASLGSYPPYFGRLPELNRRGPALVGDSATLPGLSAADVARLPAAGAEVVDVRPVADFSAGHVPGAVSIPLRAAFATWLGWIVDPDRPLVVVRGADQDPGEVAWQALKIGYDNLAGELAGGMGAWTAAGRAVATIPLIEAGAMTARRPGPRCWTSGRTASSPPGTCPARRTSSWATCRPAPTPSPAAPPS